MNCKFSIHANYTIEEIENIAKKNDFAIIDCLKEEKTIALEKVFIENGEYVLGGECLYVLEENGTNCYQAIWSDNSC